ncbi:MAG: PQQ-like beta-propeller repeat protein [Verrucomicrobia bacterium]|nr:PQQ-like beta-propeller repeat protein [Verrucomicrobiota bacterium]
MILLAASCAFQQYGASLLAQSPPGTVLWIHNVGSSVSPAVAPDGTIYLASGTALLAVSNAVTAASNLWSFAAPVTSSPAIGVDGTIYFGGYDGFYAVHPNGTLKWFYGLPGAAGAPAIGFDETIYFQSREYLYALTVAGKLKWKSAMTFPGIYSAPAVGLDGTVYIGSSDEPMLFAFNADGNRRWIREFSSTPIGGSPAINGADSVYVTSSDLYAFSPEGTNLWHTGEFLTASPVIGKDGTLYIRGFGDNRLYRVSASGQALPTGASDGIRGHPALCPAIDAGGTVWYWASNTVWALSADGQVLPWTQVIDDGYWSPNVSPVIGPDGTMYGARGSRLYAIATGTNGPAGSAWPMYRGNYRHTGKIEKPTLKQPKKRADATFEFQLYAQLGQTNVIETTTNLNTWTSLTSVVVTTVPQPVVDLTGSNFPSRLYRTVSP